MREHMACLYCGARVNKTRRGCPSCKKAIARLIDGRFEQEQYLAASGPQVTVRAWDRVGRERVLVRLLVAADPCAENALIAEAQVLQACCGNPGLPRLVHVGRIRATGMPYTVHEFVAGSPLGRSLRGVRPPQVIEYFCAALVPVAVLHVAGYVHCAVCPDHFLVAPGGRVVLVDFRQARRTGIQSGGTGIPGYKAPEQAGTMTPVTPATDVFALGACLYRLFTARFPFGEDPGELLRAGATHGKPSELNPKITTDIDEILLMALARSPVERFPSAREFYAALASRFGTTTTIDDGGGVFPWRLGDAARNLLRQIVANQPANSGHRTLPSRSPRRLLLLVAALVLASCAPWVLPAVLRAMESRTEYHSTVKSTPGDADAAGSLAGTSEPIKLRCNREEPLLLRAWPPPVAATPNDR